MAKVYLETSFVSYLVARRSRDLIVAARQQLTNDWWDYERQKYELFVSELVVQEASVGDSTEIAKRLNVLAGLPLLDINNEVTFLVNELLSKGILPPKAGSDAVHIAVATVNRMDYLLSWNCKHIANAHVRKMTERTFRDLGYESPAICTPEELGAEQ